ncbi:methyltransferase [Embleya sp. NPDC020630]|uniref:methyltransferase n=1 Tax=Embleya sp. NPDC020630 TaxID=3363979 RepID=UPI0037A0EC06
MNPAPSTAVPTGIAPEYLSDPDADRIRALIDHVCGHGAADILRAALPPGVPDAVVDMVSRHCRFDHAALLVFPERLGDLLDRLPHWGLRTTEVVPSTVVRNRIAERLGLRAESVDVHIVRCSLPGDGVAACEGRNLELFAVAPVPGADFARLRAEERVRNGETHFAFRVVEPTPVTLLDLHDLLVSRDEVLRDGGGFNPHEDTFVLYFRSTGEPASDRWPRRLEILATGSYPEVLRRHAAPNPASGRAGSPAHEDPPREDPTREMLHLVTGAWVTQAIGVAARLGLADRLGDGSRSVAELAEAAGAEPDRLGRLMRLLAGHGVLRVEADGHYRLTERGALLRTDRDGSLAALADLYSGLFFTSYLGLEHTVRTGEDAFTRVHGRESFEYFAEHPDEARLFREAMAFGTIVFDAVPAALDLPPAATVVDVGGGDGELLLRVLREHPTACGVLFERGHVVDAARELLAASVAEDRCDLVVGDFFTDPLPGGGDVYLLARILHDWADAECLVVLRALARAMPVDARLAIVERPIVEAGGSVLPLRFDIQMMTNARGRERTVAEYRALLAEGGFELLDLRPLPLDMAVLTARPRLTQE